jgi:phosphate-selective porin OprO and OprP
MKRAHWRLCATWMAGVVTALGMSTTAFAQESLEQRLERLEKQNEEIRKNAEILQKQNETLLKLLNNGATGQPVSTPSAAPLAADEVRGIVNSYLQEKEAKQAAAAAPVLEPDGRYKIGSDLRMGANWKNGLVLSTPNNDFSLHLGGWVQYDNVFWNQSGPLMNAPGARPGAKQGVGAGVSLGGIGSLEDGTYFRRIRLQTDGNFWENYEYTLTLAMENNQFNTIGLDEFWVGVKNVPFIGTARAGHVKNAIGIEADMSGSSKSMTFLERSSYSESIELNQNFVTGLWLGNNYFNERATWSAVLFRPDNGASSGVYYGNDQYGAQGRLTALQLFENDGRCLLHLGLSGGWRSGTTNNAVSSLRSVQLRARPELRDDDPAGGGPTAVPNSNSNRMIDTSPIVTSNDFLLGTELLYILGPFSVQAEYGWNYMQDATGTLSSTGVFTKFPSSQGYVFGGGYVQLAYTLTGENRSYDKRLGRLDSYYFGRQGNFTNAWFVRDEDGRLNFSMGALELAARLSHVDLNDGSGLNRIQGGIMDGLTLGINWYLNDNLKFQLDYVLDHRYDVPAGVAQGSTRGVGARVQLQY